MIVAQLGIALCGVTAIALSQDAREPWRRWSSLFGLAGQPFWFYEAFTGEQWGIFVLCFFYTWAWGRGFYRNWVRPAAFGVDS